MTAYRVSAFYKFVDLKDPAGLKSVLEEAGAAQGILGTLLLAPEGVNGTLAGREEGLAAFMNRLRHVPGLADLEEKRSVATGPPFNRFKVRLKREIVTLGVPGADPRRAVGRYVDPEDWNALVRDPQTLVIDTRNAYETAIGRFEGALDPGTASFREFPEWVDARLAGCEEQPVALYCTGGIRCEKATSLLRQRGFQQVYHLRGGILRYLERIPRESSTWQGSCFVFDGRVALEPGLEEADYRLCHGCRHPLSPVDREDPRYEPGVSCPACADHLSPDQKSRFRERHRQVLLAQRRGETHIGSGNTEGTHHDTAQPKRIAS